jgi:hypothetical protein
VCQHQVLQHGNTLCAPACQYLLPNYFMVGLGSLAAMHTQMPSAASAFGINLQRQHHAMIKDQLPALYVARELCRLTLMASGHRLVAWTASSVPAV